MSCKALDESSLVEERRVANARPAMPDLSDPASRVYFAPLLFIHSVNR